MPKARAAAKQVNRMLSYAKTNFKNDVYERINASYSKGMRFTVIFFSVYFLIFAAAIVLFASTGSTLGMSNEAISGIFFGMMAYLGIGFAVYTQLFRKKFAKDWYEYTQDYHKKDFGKYI